MSEYDKLIDIIQTLVGQGSEIVNGAKDAQALAQQLSVAVAQDTGTLSPFMIGLIVFVLAVFVGYYVVWKVTPALHSPLLAVTNAISSVIIVGAIVAAGLPLLGVTTLMGFIAVTLASVNIFGGFLVTQRMLQMFHKKQ